MSAGVILSIRSMAVSITSSAETSPFRTSSAKPRASNFRIHAQIPFFPTRQTLCSACSRHADCPIGSNLYYVSSSHLKLVVNVACLVIKDDSIVGLQREGTRSRLTSNRLCRYFTGSRFLLPLERNDMTQTCTGTS